MGCNRESNLVQDTNEDDLGLRIPEDDMAPCLTCPKLNSFSFSYKDETRSTVETGHFLLGMSIDNDHTQYGAIPVQIDLYDYMQEEGEFKYLNDDPFFRTFLDQLNVPDDTLRTLHPLTNYSKCTEDKIEEGFYNDESNYCTERGDIGLYSETMVDPKTNADGEIIAPDSVLICKLAGDICAMRSIVDLMSFNLFPYQIIDQSVENIYDKNNFRYEDPFAVLKFDNREFPQGDVEFDPEVDVKTDLKLGECPIFRSSDETNRAVPAEFSLRYDRKSNKLYVGAEWSTGGPLTKVVILLSEGSFPTEGVSASEEKSNPNGFNGEVGFELPEFTETLDENGSVTVMIQVTHMVEGEEVVNSVMFELTSGSCEEEEEG